MVLSDGAAGTVGCQKLLDGRVKSEICVPMLENGLVFSISDELTGGAKSDVKMLGRQTGRHDGIDAAVREFAKAEVTEEGLSRKDVEEDRDKSHDRHGGIGFECGHSVRPVARQYTVGPLCWSILLVSSCDRGFLVVLDEFEEIGYPDRLNEKV